MKNRRPGRPTKFIPELAERICELLEDGLSLRQIGALSDMPDRGTILRWMRADSGFADMVDRARVEQADLMDDRILEVAEKVERGELNPHAGRVVISAFQWRAEKLKPRRYGNRLDVTTTERPLEDLSDEELDARLKAAIAAVGDLAT
jgi:hypothetical protein